MRSPQMRLDLNSVYSFVCLLILILVVAVVVV